MSELRDLVAAWQRQLDECDQAYKVACVAIGRELDAVGGSATTSPDENGYCATFSWKRDNESGWTMGVAKVGDVRWGHQVPHHPEVGDRCHAMEQVWRKEAMAFGEAQQAVRTCVRKLAGGAKEAGWIAPPETIALALIKSDRSECEAAIQFARSFEEAQTVNGGQLLLNRLADALERREHLR